MKITSLTTEQEAKFGYYVNRWTEIGLSTEVADRPRAEAAMRKMYEIASSDGSVGGSISGRRSVAD